ncbi:hypothetical protein QRC94_003856 [Vibrio vulnificus]|nr:hypothetical protein [Vibrio vulnificus]ELR8548034.1 hypothetical protein [Vibrio vulnificus]ELR8552788.1 hypothetical protein [Vibrio vulnificus]
MAKKITGDTCPHCGGRSGYYVNTIYRVKQDFKFNEPDNPQAYYTQLSGGVRKQCIDCNKEVSIE